MRRTLRRVSAFTAVSAISVLIVASPAISRADPASPSPPPDKEACVRSLDEGQRLRTAKKLTTARADLVLCANEACPQVVREDCAKSLLDVDAALPTIVLSATAEGGDDLTGANVFIDGSPAPLDGRSRALDPGSHAFRFEKTGREPVTFTVLILEGEKNRQIVAKFPNASAPPPSPPSPPIAPQLPPAAAPTTERAPLPIVPIVLAGVGAGALGSALFFRLRADGDAADMRTSCAPACDASQRDALSEKLVLANVSLGIGLGALAAAAVTWVLTTRWR